MTPMADLFRNIHNETAYANRTAHRMLGDTSDIEQSDWYLEVSDVGIKACVRFVGYELG